MHSFACGGMNEGDGLRLQIKAICLVAIQFITHDRTTKAVRMGSVHPLLMRPSGMRPQRQKCHRGTVLL